MKVSEIMLDKFFLNGARNLCEIITRPQVNVLTPAINNRDIVLIGPGPSLEKFVSRAQNIHRTGYFIALGKSLGYLLEHDIIPDAVISADPYETTWDEQLSLYKNCGIPLFASFNSDPRIYKEWIGPIFPFSANWPYDRWLVMLLRNAGINVQRNWSGITISSVSVPVLASMFPASICLAGIDLGLDADGGRYVDKKMNVHSPNTDDLDTTFCELEVIATNVRKHIPLYTISQRVPEGWMGCDTPPINGNGLLVDFCNYYYKNSLKSLFFNFHIDEKIINEMAIGLKSSRNNPDAIHEIVETCKREVINAAGNNE